MRQVRIHSSRPCPRWHDKLESRADVHPPRALLSSTAHTHTETVRATDPTTRPRASIGSFALRCLLLSSDPCLTFNLALQLQCQRSELLDSNG